jgi:prepilin-type N-terminal cleavage/methylation domain-containing protein
MKNTKKMKKGFTLLEIIFAVILIGVLLVLFFPNIISNANKGDIKSTLTNDAKMITQAVTEWRGSSANSNGTYSALTTAEIVPYLPTTMVSTGTGASTIIKSTGLKSGISYQVISDSISTNGDSFKILINFSQAIANKNYDQRTITYAETTAVNTFKNMSIDPTAAQETTAATAIGAANAAFTVGGPNTDGICGVSKLKF